MACNCENITCIDVRFNPCSEGAVLPIQANETGTWTADIEFNGELFRFGFGVVSGEDIVIPTAYLNEHYNHTIEIYNVAGQVVGNTCYALKARAIATGETYPVIPSGDNNIFDITVTTGGNSVSDSRLLDRTLSHIVTDGQAYNEAFWSKPVDSDTLTSDVLTFYTGQIITVVMS